jgi:hypothetical protein
MLACMPYIMEFLRKVVVPYIMEWMEYKICNKFKLEH